MLLNKCFPNNLIDHHICLFLSKVTVATLTTEIKNESIFYKSQIQVHYEHDETSHRHNQLQTPVNQKRKLNYL